MVIISESKQDGFLKKTSLNCYSINKDKTNVDLPIDSPNSIRISDDTVNRFLEQIKLNPTITTDE